ncbi:MAG: hypothetical protein RL385_1058 [Pseudomonadota bacterium]|jgi:polyhydroxybutyrate depolymerase
MSPVTSRIHALSVSLICLLVACSEQSEGEIAKGPADAALASGLDAAAPLAAPNGPGSATTVALDAALANAPQSARPDAQVPLDASVSLAANMDAGDPAAAAVATASAVEAGAPQHSASPGCANTQAGGTGLKPGNTTRQLQVDSRARSYLVHVPATYSASVAVPLVFDFHGYSSSPQGQMGASGFRALSDEEGFIVLYPAGVGASWHVNGCCGQAGDLALDEIAFVRAILEDVGKAACIDLSRVYATGISQGGGMAHHVACLAADLFAGVAPVSSDLRTDPCTPARPITEISFRGMADSLDAYEGGHVGPPGMAGYTAIGAKPTLEKWKTINQCIGAPESMNGLCETYATCAGGTAVSLCSIPGADHVLYQNSQGLRVPKVAWDLFKKHPRR